MNVKLLKNDGRCKWLENIFLNKLVPMIPTEMTAS